MTDVIEVADIKAEAINSWSGGFEEVRVLLLNLNYLLYPSTHARVKAMLHLAQHR